MQKLQVRLRQVTHWLSDHKHQIIGVLCVAFVFAVALPIFAQAVAGEKDEAGWMDSAIIGLARFVAWVSQIVVNFVVLIINVFVVPILRYNNFVSSPIVGHGWTIVRDLVNMFFIVVLLVIAFQTIFGVGRADWRKQVPRLLIMAVVINFSRTICGIIIDFGQVIMITFVNAIKDIAGGNFINMFGLQNLYTFSTDASTRLAQEETGFGPYELFGAAFLALIISFVVAGTVLTMVFLFAFRIVVLWILIIMSPLAFFLGGAKGVIGPAEGYYSDWWKRFTGAVSLGPILTFFLWLSLAAAGGGGLAENQGFDTDVNSAELSNDSVASHLVTKAFDMPHMTSLIISLSLLFAGIEISQQTASSIGGSAGAFAKSGVAGIPGLSRQLARVGIGAPAAAGLAAGRVAGGGALNLVGAGKEWRLKKREQIGESIGAFGAGMASTKLPGFAAAGRVVRDFGFKQVTSVEHAQEQLRDEAMKGIAGLGFDQLKELADTETTYATPAEEKMRVEAAQIKMLTDKKKVAKLSPEDLQRYAKAYYDNAGSLPEDVKDKIGKSGMMVAPQMAAQNEKDNTFKGIKRENYATQEEFEAAQEKRRGEMVKEQMGVLSKNAGNLRDLDKSVYSDKLAWEAMQNTQVGTTDWTVAEWISEGRAGELQQKAYQDAEAAQVQRKVQQVAGAVTNVTQTEESVRENLAAIAADPAIALDPRLGTEMRATENDRLTNAISALTDAMNKLSFGDLQGGAVTPEMLNNEAVFNAFANSTNPVLARLSEANPALFGVVNERLEARKQDAKREFGDQYKVGGTPAAPTYTEQRTGRTWTRLEDMQADATYQRAKAERDRKINESNKAGVNMGGGAAAVGYSAAKGNFEDDAAREAFERMVVEQPEIVTKIDETKLAGAVGKAVANAVNEEVVQRLLNGVRAAPAGSNDQANLIATIDRLYLAMQKNTAAEADMAAYTRKLTALERAKKRLG